MIKRTLTIKVQGNRCVCDAPLYLHTQDKNIHVVINVTNTKFEIKDDMLLSFTIIKPNGDEVNKSDCYIDKGQCHLLFNGEDFNEETEVGTHLVQLKLYDKDRQARLSLPPFAMHILKSSGEFYADEEVEGLLAEQNAYKLMTENKLALEMNVSILISDLPTTIKVEGYAPVTQGDTTYKLDMTNVASKTYVATEIAKIGEEIDLSSYATKEDLTNELTNKANKEHTHTISDVNGLQGELDGYATETYVQAKIAEASLGGEIDLGCYATKDEVNSSLATKADRTELHSHDNKTVLDGITEDKVNVWDNKSDFDGDYNSLTNKPTLFDGDYNSLTNKPSIPTVEGLATETYVNEQVATKANRSEIPTLTSELTNDSGFITDIPLEYVTESELNAKGYLTSTSITRIELVDELPTTQETGVLYIVKAGE